MEINNKQRHLTWKNIIGYSMNTFSASSDMVTSTWQMFYYTTFCNISIVSIGLILTITKLVTGICSPIFGYISDNFYSTKLGRRFGRRKFFVLLCIPLRTILMPLIWLPGQSTLYYAIFVMLNSFATLFYNIPLKALIPEMTRNADEKIKLTGTNQVFSNVGCIVGAFFPGVVLSIYGKNNINVFLIMMICYDLLSLVSLIIYYRSVFERSPEEVGFEDKIDMKGMSPLKHIQSVVKDTSSALKIKSYKHYLFMYFGQSFCRALEGATNTYFVVFVLLLSTAIVSISMTLQYLVGMLFLGAFVMLTKKYGPLKSYRMGATVVVIALVGYITMAIYHPTNGNIFVIILAMILYGGKTGMVNSTIFQSSFIPDIDEAVTKHRREATFSSVDNFVDTLTNSFESLLVSFILATFGFISASKTQPSSVTMGILILFVGIPTFSILIGCIASYKSKFTVEKHSLLIKEVQRLKDGGSMDSASKQTKDVFKDLTGFEYEKCWGNNNVLYESKVNAADDKVNF